MNFTECVNEVLTIVKRPDKLVEAQNAVNNRLSRCILKTEFTHDLVEDSIPIDGTLYAQSIDLSALAVPLVRFRKWKYLKQPGTYRYLEPSDLQNIYRPGGFTQSDVFYMVGTKLNIITSSLSSTLDIGYYQYAPVLSGVNEHWLLTLAPYCIINLAVGELFNGMGDVNSSKYYLSSGEELYRVVVNDCRDQLTY